MDATKNKRSNGGSTNSLSKSLVNSIVFGKEIIMKKIKMKKRFGLNRQKSRGIVDNVLSGTKAGFKSILNFEYAIERKKMNNQKSKSTFNAILLSLTLMVAVFGVGLAIAAEKEMVKDPTTGKMVTAPEYGGTITFALALEPDNADTGFHHYPAIVASGVVERLGIADWAVDRDVFDFKTSYIPAEILRGQLAERWETPDPLTYIFHIRQGVHWHAKAPMKNRALTAKDVEYNFHRHLGLGSGFTEKSEGAAVSGVIDDLGIESVTAEGSTVVFRLAKLNFDALKGIFIDGIDIRDLRLAELRRRVGLVLQDVFLFSGSIAHNLTLEDPEITEADMRRAAELVGADAFISKLPDGYGQDVRERGASLSHGQRQLLSFVRALVYDPEFLVLDEATSSVDTETERLIEQALEKLMAGRTSLVVAHRLSTIQHSDRILVMHKSRIREQGAHQELLAMDGLYRRLYELQYAEQEGQQAA